MVDHNDGGQILVSLTMSVPTMIVICSNHNIEVLEDSHTTTAAETGNVKLKFTFRKTKLMKDVMHTLKMKKNLKSGSLLNKACFTQTVRSDL